MDDSEYSGPAAHQDLEGYLRDPAEILSGIRENAKILDGLLLVHRFLRFRWVLQNEVPWSDSKTLPSDLRRVSSGSGIWPKFWAGFGKMQKFLTGYGNWLRLGKRDSPNSCTGKKTVFRVEITKAREKGAGMRAHRTPFLTLAHENTI